MRNYPSGGRMLHGQKQQQHGKKTKGLIEIKPLFTNLNSVL